MRRGGIRRCCGRGIPPGSGTPLILAEPLPSARQPTRLLARARPILAAVTVLASDRCGLHISACASASSPGIRSGFLRRPGSLGEARAPVAEQRATCRNRPDQTRLERGPAQRRGRPAPSLRTARRSWVLRRCPNRLAGQGGEESSLETPGRDRHREDAALTLRRGDERRLSQGAERRPEMTRARFQLPPNLVQRDYIGTSSVSPFAFAVAQAEPRSVSQSSGSRLITNSRSAAASCASTPWSPCQWRANSEQGILVFRRGCQQLEIVVRARFRRHCVERIP